MLILASASQSRKKLLESSHIEFIQISSDFDESSIKLENSSDLALELSFCKAKSVMKKIIDKELLKDFNYKNIEILGCDSIFEFQEKSFGKPKDNFEAFNRWKNMSGEFGSLHTGHTLIFCNIDLNSKVCTFTKKIKRTVSSKVYFSKLIDEEINKYIDSSEPLYCAGGFALEGRGGKYIEKIDGCFSNVMGLSLPWLRKSLLKEGILV